MGRRKGEGDGRKRSGFVIALGGATGSGVIAYCLSFVNASTYGLINREPSSAGFPPARAFGR